MGHVVWLLANKSNFMNNFFAIQIEDDILKVKRLNFKNFSGAFEIWKKDYIQFILVQNQHNEGRAWTVDHDADINQEYLDKIVAAIHYHYKIVTATLKL